MIDQSAIMNLVEVTNHKSDLSLINELHKIFSNQTPRLLQLMTDGIRNNVDSDVFHAAHTLKSSSSYLGMEEMVSLCERLEYWTKKKEKTETEALELAKALRCTYDLAIVELGELISSLSAKSD